MATKTFAICLAVDENGDATVKIDADEIISDHLYEHGEGGPISVSTINVTVTLPEGNEVDVTVPEGAAQTVTAEVSA